MPVQNARSRKGRTIPEEIILENRIQNDAEKLEKRPSTAAVKRVVGSLMRDLMSIRKTDSYQKVQPILRRTAKLLKSTAYKGALLAAMQFSLYKSAGHLGGMLYQTLSGFASLTGKSRQSKMIKALTNLVLFEFWLGLGFASGVPVYKSVQKNLGLDEPPTYRVVVEK